MSRSSALLPVLLSTLLLAACSGLAPKVAPSPTEAAPPAAEKPLQEAQWRDLPGWEDASQDDLLPVFEGFLSACGSLARQDTWRAACAAARVADRGSLKPWFEAAFQPWQLVNPDGSRTGLVTGYYEPVVKGSRHKTKVAEVPVFGAPADLIVVDLASLYPELKSMRLRGRIEGRKLVPYYSRAEWAQQEAKREKDALLWVEDPIDFFFLQIQGSGQVQLDDGSRTRIGYADQNGHPYRSIGKWLIDQGELKPEQASMQGIRNWVKTHPLRMQELLNANPSVVFFRELPVEGSGPPGAMGLPMIPERSIAVDPKTTPLGAPVWLATTRPLSDTPMNRLVLAMDTGGAIRGPVRADFYWGSGNEAGDNAGRTRQRGQMWILMPRSYAPK
ncbi:murein transglycosylase A [Denitratisoma sp. agr-D3]